MNDRLGQMTEKILSAILRNKMKKADEARTIEARNRALEEVSHDIEEYDYSIAFKIELYNNNEEIYYDKEESNITINKVKKISGELRKSLYLLLQDIGNMSKPSSSEFIKFQNSFGKMTGGGKYDTLSINIVIGISLKYENGEIYANGFKIISNNISTSNKDIVDNSKLEKYIKNKLKLHVITEPKDESIENNVQELFEFGEPPQTTIPVPDNMFIKTNKEQPDKEHLQSIMGNYKEKNMTEAYIGGGPKPEEENILHYVQSHINRINHLLVILNTDILTKLFSLLSNIKYIAKYKDNDIIKKIFIEVEELLFSDDVDFLNASSEKYRLIYYRKMQSSDFQRHFIFIYSLFKKIQSMFVIEGEKLPEFFKCTGDICYEKVITAIRYLYSIEKNTLEIIKLVSKLTSADIDIIENDYFELIQNNKRVVTIVKRRHDNYKYDDSHPLFATTTKQYKGKLNYLDVYYRNNKTPLKLFSFCGHYAKYAKEVAEVEEVEKTAATTSISVLETERNYHEGPIYLYNNDENVEIYNTKNSYNELHKFGPFDYLYNEEETKNKNIADEIKDDLTSRLKTNDIMMIGLGQSGSGKTSTLIQLSKDGKVIEQGVLMHYLESLENLISISVSCVNLYYQEKDGENINNYDSFTDKNYLVQKIKLKSGKYDLETIDNYTDSSDIHDLQTFTSFNASTRQSKIKEIGDLILQLFSTRQIFPTSNNESSSRSHIIICLTINTNEIKNRKLIVCDLAGVENEFMCETDVDLFERQYEQIQKKSKLGDLIAESFGAAHEKCSAKPVSDYGTTLPLNSAIADFEEKISRDVTFKEKLDEAIDFFDGCISLYIIYAVFNDFGMKTSSLNISDKENEKGIAEKHMKFFTESKSKLTEIVKKDQITNEEMEEIKAIFDYLSKSFNIDGEKFNFNFKPEAIYEDINNVNSKYFDDFEKVYFAGYTFESKDKLKSFKEEASIDINNDRDFGYVIKNTTGSDINSISRLTQNENNYKINVIDFLKFIKYSKTINVVIGIKSYSDFKAVFSKRPNKKKLFDKIKDHIIDSEKPFINKIYQLMEDKNKKIQDIQCLRERKTRIIEQCQRRLKEGFMINKSLAELSEGITTIVSENSFYGSPIYIERQIAPSCRHAFLDYFNFDKYDKKTSDDASKYGIILNIIKNYFKVKFKNFYIYTLLLYNTSFFSEPLQNGYTLPADKGNVNLTGFYNKFGKYLIYTTPNEYNTGIKNNPPKPSYVNINILKYFTYVNNDNIDTLRQIAKYYKAYILSFDFYKKDEGMFQVIEQGHAITDIIKILKDWITYIERNNAGTFLGALETTDSIQSISFKDVRCNSIADTDAADSNLTEILKLYDESKKYVTKKLEKSFFDSPLKDESDELNIETIIKKSSTFNAFGTRRGGRRTRKKYKKKRKTRNKKRKVNMSKVINKKVLKTKRI
jgi:hypothetical protein